MNKMIWLQTETAKILVNPELIEFICSINEYNHSLGSVICFTGRNNTLKVLETIEEIDRKISL